MVGRLAAPSAERGDTLIELLISIVVLSVGVLGIYSALTSSIAAADLVKGRADVAQVVTRVADAVQRAPWECPEKAIASYYELFIKVRPSPSWTVELTEVSHWGPSRSFEDGCPSPNAPAVFQTQRLRIAVVAPGARAKQTLELVKRP